jgi:hypothetical protein
MSIFGRSLPFAKGRCRSKQPVSNDGSRHERASKKQICLRLIQSAPPLLAAYLRNGWDRPAFYGCYLKLAHHFTHQLFKLFD